MNNEEILLQILQEMEEIKKRLSKIDKTQKTIADDAMANIQILNKNLKNVKDSILKKLAK